MRLWDRLRHAIWGYHCYEMYVDNITTVTGHIYGVITWKCLFCPQVLRG